MNNWREGLNHPLDLVSCSRPVVGIDPSPDAYLYPTLCDAHLHVNLFLVVGVVHMIWLL